MTLDIPLSLYIHLPWCIKKCPYCDFNSHGIGHANHMPEQDYIYALIQDLKQDQHHAQGRTIQSIFLGGGTPSLFSPKSLKKIFDVIHNEFSVAQNVEITLETNPGTMEHHALTGYIDAGINRFSLGAQSFNDTHLKKLGRIHRAQQTKSLLLELQSLQSCTFNIDIMYGLPKQTFEEALNDLKTAISFKPQHISWYQLTLEPNTQFFHAPPPLPENDDIWQMQQAGETLLAKHGYQHYEVSAFAKPNAQCIHNLNYWTYGDYLAIGAGAHGKITNLQTGEITRFSKTRHPKAYLKNIPNVISTQNIIASQDIPFEFMLNQLRIMKGFKLQNFTERTARPVAYIENALKIAENKKLLYISEENVMLTDLGKQFLNDVMQLFLRDNHDSAYI